MIMLVTSWQVCLVAYIAMRLMVLERHGRKASGARVSASTTIVPGEFVYGL